MTDQRTCLVTGGGRGIGRAIAERFAIDGARVLIADVDAGSAAETVGAITASGGTAVSVHADLATPAGVETVLAACADHGGIDVLVNNAARFSRTDPLEMEASEWDSLHHVGLRAAFLLSQGAARAMIAAGRPGVIINVSSVQAHRPWAQNWAYGAVKAGLLGLSRAMAQYLAPYGIRVCVISPGAIASGGPDLYHQTDGQGLHRSVPLDRYGTSDEVAEAVAFLASAKAGYVTGAEFTVDGGMLVTGPEV